MSGRGVRLKRLQRRCEDLLERVEIPDPFDIETFLNLLAARRGRPLHVLPLPEQYGPLAPCGIWVATDIVDWVLVRSGTSDLHRDAILLHEIGHMVAGHQLLPMLDSSVPQWLLPHLDRDMVKRVLGRTGYSEEREQEAEMLSSLILSRGGTRSADPPSTVAPSPDIGQVLDRLSRVLGALR